MPDPGSARKSGTFSTAGRVVSFLSHEDVCAELVEHFRESLASKPPEWLEKTSCLLAEAFADWKEQHGNRTPRRWRSGKGLPAKKPIAFSDAEPFECAPAESGVCDYPSLLLHLLDIDDEKVLLILSTERMDELLAASVLLAPHLLGLDSLLRCLRLHDRIALTYAKDRDLQLTGLREVVSESAGKLRMAATVDNSLNNGRKIGTKTRQDASAASKAEWRAEAIHRINKFGLTLEEAAKAIARIEHLNLKQRSWRTIHSAIKGCISEDKKRLRAAK